MTVLPGRDRLGLGDAGLGDGIPHLRIGHDILHIIIVHDAQLAFAQGLGQGQGDFGLGFDDLGLHFLGISLHFLLFGDSHGPPFFGLGLGDLLVRFGLVGLQSGADVAAYVDIGNVDGQDFKSRPGVEALAEDGLTDFVRILQDLRMVPCRADAGDDAFADAGDDRRFTGTADEAVDVGADRDPGPDLQFDAVLGDSRAERRCLLYTSDAADEL